MKGGGGNSEAVSAGVANDNLLERLNDDGYALINRNICSNDLRENVGRGISELEVQHKIPATFVLLFDETWKMASESHHLLLRKSEQKKGLKGVLHANNMAFNFDMLAWHIDPRLNQSGFSPHRDRQPDTVSALEKSFYDDGQAKYVTHWIALADATPENSCLYVIPKQFDPGHLKGDDPPDEADVARSNESSNKENNNEQFSDPLSRALNTKQSYQNIRALPRQAGQSLIFTHRILHWGSAGNKQALDVQPRIAISLVYSDAEFEAPYLSEQSFSEDNNGEWHCPPFSIRLLLVCAQLLIYYQRFNLSTATIRACYEYCKSREHKLHETYRKKVFVEYVKAMKERRDGVEDEDIGKCATKDNESNDADGVNSEDEEALLEAMLNHSDEFDDDYDDICSEDDSHNGTNKKRKVMK